MVKLVDFEALQEGDNFIFIKTLKEDGSVDSRIGTNGPYEIVAIARAEEVRISYPKGLNHDLVEKMVRQFTRSN